MNSDEMAFVVMLINKTFLKTFHFSACVRVLIPAFLGPPEYIHSFDGHISWFFIFAILKYLLFASLEKVIETKRETIFHWD